jgi:hypothetical protein
MNRPWLKSFGYVLALAVLAATSPACRPADAAVFGKQVGSGSGGGSTACVQVDGGGCVPIVQSLDHYIALSAPATSITLTGLNGNAEGGYSIVACGTVPAVSSANWQLKPNGSASNLVARVGDVVAGSSSISTWTFGNTGPYGFASGTRFCFKGHMDARTGRVRQIWVEGYSADSNQDALYLVGQWTDTTTNLTSFTMVTGQANGFTNTGSGTFLKFTADNTDK